MRRLVSLVLFLVVLSGIPVGASTFLQMGQRDLIRASELVVEGEVLQVHSFWEPSGRIIVTEAIVRVRDAVVGDAPTAVVVRTFGGTVEGFTVEAHGFPTFQRGERLLLFLEPERDGAARIAGYQQGQFRIVEEKGVEIAVSAVEGDANIVTRDGRPAPRMKAMALATLKDQIRAEARRAGRLEN